MKAMRMMKHLMTVSIKQNSKQETLNKPIINFKLKIYVIAFSTKFYISIHIVRKNSICSKKKLKIVFKN